MGEQYDGCEEWLAKMGRVLNGPYGSAIQWLVVQDEMVPFSHRTHVRWAVKFHRPRRLSSVMTILWPGFEDGGIQMDFPLEMEVAWHRRCRRENGDGREPMDMWHAERLIHGEPTRIPGHKYYATSVRQLLHEIHRHWARNDVSFNWMFDSPRYQEVTETHWDYVKFLYGNHDSTKCYETMEEID